jgi:FtsZ-binding cell division protein ZapB
MNENSACLRLSTPNLVGSVWVAVAMLSFSHELMAQAEVVDAVIGEQARTESAARDSQLRVAQLDEEATQMLGEYRQVVAEASNLETYNEQLAAQVASQQEEITGMLTQLEQIETTSSEVLPMMTRMLDTLEQFVALDLPFLRDERQLRVDNLKAIMRRADVSLSEKYRRIVEAYGVEMEYGRTIEAYRDEIVSNGEEARMVDALRVGRVALMYQTLDGAETGYWDAVAGQWVVDDSFRSSVRDGLRVAKQQAAPDLMIMPVRSPKESEL